MTNSTTLKAIILSTAKANSNVRTIRTDEHSFDSLFLVQSQILDLYKEQIRINGIAFKSEMVDDMYSIIENNNISMMPYGHAIISEARKELSMLFNETSNAYSA